MFGSVTNFTAIINPPQAAIMAIGGARRELNASLEAESKFVFIFVANLIVSVTVVVFIFQFLCF